MTDRSPASILLDVSMLEHHAELESDDRATVELERVRISAYLVRSGVLRAEAKRARAMSDAALRQAKDQLSYVHAVLYKKFREELAMEDSRGRPKPPTEGTLESEITQDASWIVARDELRDLELADIDARHTEDRAWSCWEALRSKQAMLASLAADFRAELADPTQAREAREAREDRELQAEIPKF